MFMCLEPMWCRTIAEEVATKSLFILKIGHSFESRKDVLLPCGWSHAYLQKRKLFMCLASI